MASASQMSARVRSKSARYQDVMADECVAVASRRRSPSRRERATASAKSAAARAVWLTDCSSIACWLSAAAVECSSPSSR